MLQSQINDLAKISIIGHPAVGKTTILKLLSENTINRIYLPTQGFDLKTVKFGNYSIKLWDFGGQKNYLKTYLKDYLIGSDIVFVVTDSTPRNVLTSKELIEFADNIVDADCPIIAIANKQDLCKVDGRMEAERVENVLRRKTYGLSAIQSEQRDKLLNIMKKELDHLIMRKEMNKE